MSEKSSFRPMSFDHAIEVGLACVCDNMEDVRRIAKAGPNKSETDVQFCKLLAGLILAIVSKESAEVNRDAAIRQTLDTIKFQRGK